MFAGQLVKMVDSSIVGTEQELRPLLDALNSLASTAWRVNPYMHNNLLKVFYDGGSVKLKVPRDPDLLGVEDLMIQQ